MERRWVKITILALVWAFVGLLLAAEMYFNFRASMPNQLVVFWDLAMPQFVRAVMWGLVAPLILMAREKMPLHRGHWFGGVAFHLFFSFLIMAVFYLGRMYFGMLGSDEPMSPFWEASVNGFYGRNIIDMAFYWAVLAFGFSNEIYRKYRSEELKTAQLETRLIETELKALRQQMHPHFLFNTLNTIAVLVREQKNDEAVTLVARLSTLLRMTLDNTGVQEVTLRQEHAIAAERLASLVACSFPRAEMTYLSYLMEQHPGPLAAEISACGTNRDRCAIVTNALENNRPLGLSNPSDLAAVQRMRGVLSAPYVKLHDIQGHATNALLRLYR